MRTEYLTSNAKTMVLYLSAAYKPLHPLLQLLLLLLLITLPTNSRTSQTDLLPSRPTDAGTTEVRTMGEVDAITKEEAMTEEEAATEAVANIQVNERPTTSITYNDEEEETILVTTGTLLVAATESTTEKLMEAQSNISVTTAPDVALTPPCRCCNISFHNLSITVFGSRMTVTGSAQNLDLAEVTALCPEATSVNVRTGVREMMGEGSQLSQIIELDLSYNALESVPETVLNMAGLRRLGFAGNSITKLPQDKLEKLFRRLDAVDLRGNPLRCSSELTWLHDVTSIQHWDRLTCVGQRRDPFGNDRKPLRPVIEEMWRVNDTCPARCRCRLDNLQPLQVFVDCSGAELAEIPSSLPLGATALNISGNQIISLPLCRLLSSHRSLSSLLLSHNQLSDVTRSDLACAIRLGRLDLRHNRLTQLAWDELATALRGPRLNVVYLSHNPWDCEYETEAMQLWRFLVGHHRAVLDFNDVLCSADGSVHTGKQAVKLLAEDNLWHQPVKVNPLDVVIGVEVLLIGAIFGKFAHDVRAYWQSGRLPWPLRRADCWKPDVLS